MPITRKQQLLAKLETTEGGGATFAAADAVEVFDPSISDTVDQLDRSPAGSTLSRDFTPVGRKTREVTFTSDLKGSGTASTVPPWGLLLEACGYRQDDDGTRSFRILNVSFGSITGAFQVGEQITQTSSNVGVIVGVFSSANAPKLASTADSDYAIVVEVKGTLTSTTATTGSSSGATDSTLTVATTSNHHAYMPTSKKLLNITIGSWAVDANPVAGEVFLVKNGSTLVGSVQLIEEHSATDLDVTLLWGEIADGYTLTESGGETATISGDPDPVLTPSLAVRHNLDGRNRLLLGSRGSFSMTGEVGEPLSFSWTFTGDVGTDADAVPIATSGLSTTRAPRLLGAICAYGEGSNIRDLQTKSITFDSGNTVASNLDANSTGGATGANVTDRDPSITVQVDNTLSTTDWESLRDNGSTVRAAFVLGSTAGNIVSLVAPVCQVTEVSIGDADGVSVMDVTLRPRRINETGDDEVYICQL
jgi:hypothetical protein